MLRTGPISIVCARDALVTPFKYDRGEPRTLSGSVYDKNGVAIEQSRRGGGHQGDLVLSCDPPVIDLSSQGEWREIPGRTIYLGHMMAQYGHWITEGVSSFWGTAHTSFDAVLFHPFVFGSRRQPFMFPFFEAHHIPPERIVIARTPLRLKEVVIPERSFTVGHSVHEVYRDVIAPLRRPHANRSRRVFLSRSKLPQKAREVANREEIEGVAAELGFEIVHPQELSYPDQLQLFAETLVMCGYSGSALHNSVFLSDNSMLVELGDMRAQQDSSITQHLCNIASGCREVHVPFSGERTEAGYVASPRDVREALKQALSESGSGAV